MKVYQPRKEIQPFVAMSYVISGQSESNQKFNELALPSGYCFMVFQYLGGFSIKNNVTGKIYNLPKFYLTGQQVSSFNIFSKDKNFEAAVILLKPTAIWHLFGLNMEFLVDTVIDIEPIFRKKLNLFKLRFFELTHIEERLQCFEDLLLDKIESVSYKPNVIDIAIEEIIKAKGCIKINEIAKLVHMSVGYFRRKFKLIIGISPSVYTRIIRFNYLFTHMNDEGKQNFKTLGTWFNYYDAAHFSKDFKRYCGHSPKNFHLEKFKYFKEIWVDDPLMLKIS